MVTRLSGATVWRAYAAGGLICCGLYLLLPPAAGQSVLYDLVGLSAVIAIVLGVKIHRPANPWPWLLFAGGGLLSVGADAMWTANEAITGADPPFPWYADILYLASYPALAAGMLAIVRLRTPRGDRDALLDALIVAVGAGTVSWVFLMQPSVSDGSLGVLGRIIALAYPATDLILIGTAVRFLSAGGFRLPAISMLFGALGALLVADTYYTWAVLKGTYGSGDPIDIVWLLSYVGFGAAALHPSMRRASERAEPNEPARITIWRLALLVVAVLSGPALIVARLALDSTDGLAVLRAATVALFVLALLRLGSIAFRLNEALDERHATEARLRASENRFRRAFVHAPIGMALVADNGRWLQVNQALCEMLGYAEEELLATTWMAVAHPDDRDARAAGPRLDGLSASGHLIERRYLHKDGQIISTIQGISIVPSTDGHAPHEVWQIQDVTARKKLEAELRQLALHDPLTGLPNRTLFADRLKHALDANRRQEFVGVLFLDLDRFKAVNDSLGHTAGDRLLRAAAARLGDELRAGDTLARFGGDEFVALLEGLQSPLEATEVAKRLVDVAKEPFPLGEEEAVIGVSIGVAVGKAGTNQAEELLRHADLALYRAKSAGRGTHAVFNPEMHDETARRLELEADLRRALERGELSLHYQPIVDLRDGRVVGAEALVRWAHPTRGLIAPDEFIDLAEETGLIVPLGDWALEEACRRGAQWQGDGEPFLISVNVSARQVRHAGLPATVKRALAAAGLPVAALQLELTERALVDNGAASSAVLRELNGLGVGLAIDDFGTGYSSLGALRHLPVRALKLDRSFVAGLEGLGDGEALVDAVATLARALDLTITAEGIETEGQLVAVSEAGCELGQGYFFSPPVTPEAFELFLVPDRFAALLREPDRVAL